MFFFRIVFWFSLVIFFLPLQRPPKNYEEMNNINLLEENYQIENQIETLSISRIGRATKSVISDITGICARNPKACDTGLDVFLRLKDNASYGLSLLNRWKEQPDQINKTIANFSPNDTLEPEDYNPEWSRPSDDQF
ncbi:MAG: DUF5330 domain-containing protein [Alphaproteobacteria bacterium]|nr:DUF5330 domain-containing protein [Alphaproteobacteria bacterium]